MSILKKYIIRHRFIDVPACLQEVREMIPYHCNMLNATEEAARMKINQGELKEISDRQWEFTYISEERKQTITVLMTDEELEFGANKGSGFRKIAPPTFK